MRYCPHCQRLNAGQPQLCNYCGRTWHVRLCPRGHENPPDAQFCGNCGSADLSETAGPIPFWIWMIRMCILVVLVLLIASIGGIQFHLTDQHITFVITITILLITIQFAFSMIPGPVMRIVRSMFRIFKKVGMIVCRWFWEKLKNLFS